MRRIAVLTAGGDTPALNATIYGVVERANQLGIEVFGIMKGFGGMIDPRVPHLHLNPLFTTIPELDPCLGGTILGASRTYSSGEETNLLKAVAGRRLGLGIEGMICIGGDGTISGMQPLSEYFPCVLAPKTIDNDLGLNYLDEPNDWIREDAGGKKARYLTRESRDVIELEDIVNYATPGYATAAYSDPATGFTVAVVLNDSTKGAAIVQSLAWELAALASKAPAASGQTAPEFGLPFSAEQYHQAITDAAIVCVAPPEG